MYPVSAHLSQFPLRPFFLCPLRPILFYSLGRLFASLVLALRLSPAPLRPVCSCNSCSTPFYSALPWASQAVSAAFYSKKQNLPRVTYSLSSRSPSPFRSRPCRTAPSPTPLAR